jgi:predicted HicB family RNase H-like nuclease
MTEPRSAAPMTDVLFVRVPQKLARNLRRRARYAGKSVAAYVRAVLENCKDMGPW